MTEGLMPLSLRRATAADAAAIAAVFSASFRLLTFLPSLHTPAEDRRFIEEVILAHYEVTLAEDASGIVSFLARGGEEVRLLYTRPDRVGTGAGTLLIEAAKASGVAALELWCFQANTRARRFYESRGFRAIRFTGGADNEERTPDVRYRWQRAGGHGVTGGGRQQAEPHEPCGRSNPRGPFETKVGAVCPRPRPRSGTAPVRIL
jgi:GNAT superfamily N-acetyltransferase